MMPRVIILEGPDGGGKSTLANALADRYSAGIDHHGPYPDDRQPWHRYARSLIDVADDRDGATLVMDRSWISEWPYGQVFRNQIRFDRTAARGLERLAISMRAVVINCTPSDPETVLAAYRQRKNTEYLDNENQLRKIHDWYHKHTARSTCLPVMRYDRDQMDLDEGLEQVSKIIEGDPYGSDHLLRMLEGEPVKHGLIGNPYQANTLILADKANASPKDLPFFGLTGCSPWLSHRLEDARVPESQLAWMNVRTPDGRFKAPWAVNQWHLHRTTEENANQLAFDDGNNVNVIALGAVAAAWAEGAGIEATTIRHPQAHKRFRYHEPYSLGDVINQMREVA